MMSYTTTSSDGVTSLGAAPTTADCKYLPKPAFYLD